MKDVKFESCRIRSNLCELPPTFLTNNCPYFNDVSRLHKVPCRNKLQKPQEAVKAVEYNIVTKNHLDDRLRDTFKGNDKTSLAKSKSVTYGDNSHLNISRVMYNEFQNALPKVGKKDCVDKSAPAEKTEFNSETNTIKSCGKGHFKKILNFEDPNNDNRRVEIVEVNHLKSILKNPLHNANQTKNVPNHKVFDVVTSVGTDDEFDSCQEVRTLQGHASKVKSKMYKKSLSASKEIIKINYGGDPDGMVPQIVDVQRPYSYIEGAGKFNVDDDPYKLVKENELDKQNVSKQKVCVKVRSKLSAIKLRQKRSRILSNNSSGSDFTER